MRIFAALVVVTACARCASTSSGTGIDRNAAAAIAGEWGIQTKEGGHTVDGTLHFSFDGTGIVGTYSGPEGEVRELERLSVSSTGISWKMDTKEGTLTARGNVNGTIMTGKMKLHRSDEESGFSAGGRGGRGSGGRAPEISFAWTAIKRAESPAP